MHRDFYAKLDHFGAELHTRSMAVERAHIFQSYSRTEMRKAIAIREWLMLLHDHRRILLDFNCAAALTICTQPFDDIYLETRKIMTCQVKTYVPGNHLKVL